LPVGHFNLTHSTSSTSRVVVSLDGGLFDLNSGVAVIFKSGT
jgi:hypothetical protein